MLAWFATGKPLAQYTISTVATGGPNYTIDGIGLAADTTGNFYATGQVGGANVIFELRAGVPPYVIAGTAAVNPPPPCPPVYPATQVELVALGGVAVDNSGSVYVAQSGNGSILKININGGTITCLTPQIGGTGVVADNSGNVYYSLGQSNIVCEVTSSGANIVAGVPGSCGQNGGVGNDCTAPKIGSPQGLALDAAGDLYIADEYCNTIWKVTPSGTITHIGVAGPVGGYQDGPVTSALLKGPNGVAVDQNNNIYIADTGNVRIRMVTSGTMSTIAGTGNPGTPSDCQPATSANLVNPYSITAGLAGVVYFGEHDGNRIIQLVPAGTQTISPPPGSVLPGNTVTFSWCASTSPYELDVGNAIGQGDIFASSNLTTTSVSVPNIPCDGRTIYVKFVASGQLPSSYTYTACKMLHLSLSPSQLPLQGGPVTCSIQMENFSGSTEVVQLTSVIVLQARPCGLTMRLPLFPYPTSVTLPLNTPEVVSYTRKIQPRRKNCPALLICTAYLYSGTTVLDHARSNTASEPAP
jgi:hypothetical protein